MIRTIKGSNTTFEPYFFHTPPLLGPPSLGRSFFMECDPVALSQRGKYKPPGDQVGMITCPFREIFNFLKFF